MAVYVAAHLHFYEGCIMRTTALPLVFALLALGPQGADASTAYGDLNNFDTVNDTGHECHGFEIEIEGAHSTDITYTYDWNHYGAPRITDDNSDPAHPKVVIRYQSARNPDGSWAAFTAIPQQPLTPTDGHSCTNPAVNDGCEHYGVGFYGNPTAVRYHWLYDDGTGNLVYSEPVMVATPNWTYAPPAAGEPAIVVAAIPAPVVPIPANLQFGEPSWVKVIKTTTHNANDIALEDLISDDTDFDGLAEWQNVEPAEVESEFRLLQANSAPDDAKDELIGLGDDMGDGSETVTRRYEFYKYAAAADTLDGENGEAMCDEVDPDAGPGDPQYLHGIGIREVTDANGDWYEVDCGAQVVVGDYIGAQMAGFEAAMPLGLIENLQDGDTSASYTPRTLVVGGNTPYDIEVTAGSLPPGLILGDYADPVSGDTAHGVLFGTPTTAGAFNFAVHATDADDIVVSKAYTLNVAGDIVEPTQFLLAVDKLGSGSGTVVGNGIDCGATCELMLEEGTTATLAATAAIGSVFDHWGGACAGTGNCVTVVNADTYVTATFTQQYQLTVSKTGAGAGTVTGNGIDCGVTCNVSLDSGTAISLTAVPAAGSVFTGWSGDCSGMGACSTTMSVNRSVTANFAPAPSKYTLTVVRTGSGTVTSQPKGINCGNKCSLAFATGSNVTLTAKPAKKHLFLGWSGGGCSGNALTCVVPMTSAQTVNAQFN